MWKITVRTANLETTLSGVNLDIVMRQSISALAACYYLSLINYALVSYAIVYSPHYLGGHPGSYKGPMFPGRSRKVAAH